MNKIQKLFINLVPNQLILTVFSGRLTMPYLTTYSMTKHAIKSFSDGLRRELNGSKIKIITIEPTMYRTPITDWNIIKNNTDKVWNQTSIEVQNTYDEKWHKNFNKTTQLILKFSRKNTEEVVNAMISAVTLENPQIYYRCGGLIDHISLFVFIYFPELLQDFIINIILKNPLLMRFYGTILSNTKSN